MSKYGKGDQTMMTKDKHTDNDQTMMTKDKHTDKDQKRQLPFYKSGQLQGKYRCVIRRQHNFPLERGKQEAQTIGRAIVMKELITDCLRSGILDEAHIQHKLEEMFQSMAFPTRATADAYAKEAYLQIKRYVTGELHQLQRLEGTQCVPVSPLFLEKNRGKKRRLLSVALPETFTLFGLFSLEVKPDLVFYGEKEYIREQIVTGPRGRKKKEKYRVTEPYLEVVKLRTSAPTVTQSGRKRDESAGQCMELYGMLLYGRSLLSAEETGIHVEASYYFLRNPKDSKELIADFFGKENTKCRITLSEWHEKEADGTTEAEQMDARFAPQFQAFAEGEKLQEEKSCTYCEWCTVCQYNHAIKPMETVKTISTSKGLQLTTQQQEAIAFRKGIARINAGAGAGKTLVTAMRVARLLLEGIAPGEICLLTFTRTGAEEMRQRVLQYAREMGYRQNLEDLVSTTFNGFGNEIITRNYWLFGFTEPPRLLDEMERSLILTELLDQNPVEGLDYRNFSLNLPAVKGAFAVTAKAFDLFKCKRYRQQDRHTLCADLQKDGISLAAGTVETHTLCADLQKDGISLEPKAAEALFQLFLQYEEILKSRNLIEYADQEILILDLLEREPEYFHDCGFKHLIVDEFQDTNLQQLEIVRHLIRNPDFTSLMVVGDDSQSIFSFRGADYRVMLQFPNLIGRPVTDFYLLENHRSTPEILEFANQVNQRNQNRVEKDLLPVRASGSDVTVKSFEDKETELQWIITRMQNRHQAGIPWEDMAYIAYTRAELLQMRAVCTEAGIPCSLYNPEPLMDNSRVQGALSLIHFLQDPTSTQDAFIYLNAVSRNQLLEKTEEEVQEEILKLQETAEKLMESQDVNLLKAMLEALNEEDELYEQFLQILLSKETTKEIITYALACARYGEHLAFKRQKTYQGIVLTTAHSSKGMEWPVVFNSISQYHQKDLEEEELEERRRLFFVSVTRARDELYITGQTVAYGSRENRVYNRYLQESFEILGQSQDRETEPTEKTQGTDARFWEKAC